MSFNPNQMTLKEGLELVKEIQADLRLDTSKIFTSKQAGNLYKNKKALVTNVPGGFSKIMLPISTSKEATFYISAGAPNTEAPKHSHDEGEGIRIIMSGSIIFDGQELSEGDWMYVPPKAQYSFKVGPRGCLLCYCYCCCCASAR
jgi:quercetin dioxygenase-like cupin family protein